TPLTDGRTYTPPYAAATGSGAGPSDDPTVATTTPGGDPSAAAPNSKDNTADPNPGTAAAGAQKESAPAWVGWTTGAIALFALLPTLRPVAGLRPSRSAARRRLLTRVAIVCWLLAVPLAAALASPWLSALIVALTLAAAPGFIREWRRRSRRHAVHRNLPAA